MVICVEASSSDGRSEMNHSVEAAVLYLILCQRVKHAGERNAMVAMFDTTQPSGLRKVTNWLACVNPMLAGMVGGACWPSLGDPIKKISFQSLSDDKPSSGAHFFC